jgi:hypothetical protein
VTPHPRDSRLVSSVEKYQGWTDVGHMDRCEVARDQGWEG